MTAYYISLSVSTFFTEQTSSKNRSIFCCSSFSFSWSLTLLQKKKVKTKPQVLYQDAKSWGKSDGLQSHHVAIAYFLHSSLSKSLI